MDDIYEIDEHHNEVALIMKLASSTIPFVLISDETTAMLKALIKEVAYTVLTVKVDPVVLVNHVNQHDSTQASYYFSRGEVKIMNIITKSSIPFYWDQIFPQAAILSKFVICFVRQKAVNRD
jgi:hypothetical protein